MYFVRRLWFSIWYLFRPPWDTGVSPPELLEFIRQHPPGRALDLGCGTGTNAITLARHGWEVIGIDFAHLAIREARAKARQAGVKAKFLVGDVTRLEGIEGPCDLILDIGCFHSLSAEGRERYAREIGRLLAPGGTYLMYCMLKPDRASGGPGLVEEDLHLFEPQLQMVHRQNGINRRTRPSAWVTYIRPGRRIT